VTVQVTPRREYRDNIAANAKMVRFNGNRRIDLPVGQVFSVHLKQQGGRDYEGTWYLNQEQPKRPPAPFDFSFQDFQIL
jgi:hypothetical protein